MKTLGLALVASLLLAAALAPAAGATFGGERGPIVFFSLDRQDDRFLYEIDPGGGPVRPGPVAGDYVAYPNAGGVLAYVFENGLYVSETDGDNARRVATGPISEPAWSPAGISEIVYTQVNDEDDPFLRIVDVNTGVVRHLTAGEHASWSADGKTIVYNTPHGAALCAIRPDGGNQRCFKPVSKHGARDPDVSPGGRAIVVGIRDRIAVLRRDGRFARWISPPIEQKGPIATRVFNPSWSPDGRYVVYERGKGFGRGSLYVTGDRGGRQRHLTGGIRPVWSPKRYPQ